MEILDNYERIEYQNTKKKGKTIEAMNYSILSGIILDRTVKGWYRMKISFWNFLFFQSFLWIPDSGKKTFFYFFSSN